jgi:hypothetical protein
LTTSVEILRDSTGTAAGPELVAGVTDMPTARFDQLAERLLAEPPHPSATPPQTEVWPLVTARASTFATGGGANYSDAPGAAGLNLNAAMNPRHAGSGRFSDGVLRALLYCHGLVIEDPVVMAAEMYLTTSQEARPVARLAMNAAVTSLVEIALLVDAGIVQTFFMPIAAQDPAWSIRGQITAQLNDPAAQFTADDVWDAFEGTYVDGLAAPLRELWRRIRSGDRSPPLDLVRQGLEHDDAGLVRTFIDALAQLRPSAVVDNAVDIVASALAGLRQLGGRYDLLCPSPLFAKLLFVGTPDPTHELRLHELSRIDVPGIQQLLVGDVVRIRQASEAFALWRTRLSLGLERAHRLRADLGPQLETAEVVGEVLADARASLFQEAKRSQVLGASGSMAFVAGAVGGAVGGATGGAAGMLIGGLGGLLPPVIQAIADARRGVPGFLRRHYLVFEKKLDAGRE